MNPRNLMTAAIVIGWMAAVAPGPVAANPSAAVEASRLLPARVAPLQERIPGHFWLIALGGVLIALRALRVNR